MTSAVEICNLALAKIGHGPFIASLSEKSKAAELFSALYEPTKKTLLREYLWRFARKMVQLAPLTDQPAFDGGNYFQKPQDCLRIVGTDQDYYHNYGRWSVEGSRIVADTTLLNLVYISDVTDPNDFDPIFVQAFAARLAHEIAMPLAQSQSLKKVMLDEANRMMVKAAFVGATEKDGEKFLADIFINYHY